MYSGAIKLLFLLSKVDDKSLFAVDVEVNYNEDVD
jgi:hypothetical protein